MAKPTPYPFIKRSHHLHSHPYVHPQPHPLRRLPRTMYTNVIDSKARPRRTCSFILTVPVTIFVIFFFFLTHSEKPGLATENVRVQPAPMASQPKPLHKRGILMSCPQGQSHTNKGPWKPSKMTLGIEAVLKQILRKNSTLPLYIGYYPREKLHTNPFCDRLKRQFARIEVSCFEIPEVYPTGLYGYAKVFAIKHVPLKEVLWLDCDVYPVRALDGLFDDAEFRRTRAMFWADSRDFFDESKLHSVLTPHQQKLFPTEAWYVRQGFDSGMVLLDRAVCAREIEEMCRIARSTQAKALRNMSMGDKDLFHIVWMRHSKNFTLVPYIGETGSLQTHLRNIRKLKHSNRVVGKRVHWAMSSQVKHGRDGTIYALHQLHKQHPLSLIAALSETQSFFSTRVTRSTTHVKPFITARLDLRLMKPGYRSKKPAVGDFVPDVEDALIGTSGMPKVVRLQEKGLTKKGLMVEWTPAWIHAAATEMGRAWRHGIDASSAARAIYGDYRKVLLMKRINGAYRKRIYRRLWNERGLKRRRDDDRGIRGKFPGT